MSDYLIVTICSHTAAIPAIAGLIRYRHVLKAYRPFLIVLMLGCLNEIVSTLLIYHKMNNAVNANIYVLAELLGILLLFRNWGTHPKRFIIYQVAGLFTTGVWVVENVILYELDEINALYRFFYSAVISFLCIDQINHVVFVERTKISSNPKFIICCGLLLYFTFRGIIESLFFLELNLSMAFYREFMLVLVILNVITNILFTIAVIWMPTGPSFSLRY